MSWAPWAHDMVMWYWLEDTLIWQLSIKLKTESLKLRAATLARKWNFTLVFLKKTVKWLPSFLGCIDNPNFITRGFPPLWNAEMEGIV